MEMFNPFVHLKNQIIKPIVDKAGGYYDLIVYDNSGVSNENWWVAGAAVGNCTKSFTCDRASDAHNVFNQIDTYMGEGADYITEIQFWCHGSTEAALIGGRAIDPESFGKIKRHMSKKYKTYIWLRTCNAGNSLQYMKDVAHYSGADYVGAHKCVIGVL